MKRTEIFTRNFLPLGLIAWMVGCFSSDASEDPGVMATQENEIHGAMRAAVDWLISDFEKADEIALREHPREGVKIEGKWMVGFTPFGEGTGFIVHPPPGEVVFSPGAEEAWRSISDALKTTEAWADYLPPLHTTATDPPPGEHSMTIRMVRFAKTEDGSYRGQFLVRPPWSLRNGHWNRPKHFHSHGVFVREEDGAWSVIRPRRPTMLRVPHQ